jgi:hypothetical protein
LAIPFIILKGEPGASDKLSRPVEITD